MKTVTVNELHQRLDEYLVQAQVEEIVIRLNNGELLRLSAISPEDLADEALESDPRFEQLITERRERYKQSGGVPFTTVRQVLIDELIQNLNHTDPQVRQEAAKYLAELDQVAPKVDPGE
ncbi:MAG: hypothetical protein Fur0044_20340 [Anaerolineae bacterium]|nr:hypothetical protein [Anaerolineales bacterium]MCK6629555.1 hypothetical protein [Anaerolineae bacterium]MCQ3978316.1 hypothetical protein [Anaerolineae bacterium]